MKRTSFWNVKFIGVSYNGRKLLETSVPRSKYSTGILDSLQGKADRCPPIYARGSVKSSKIKWNCPAPTQVFKQIVVGCFRRDFPCNDTQMCSTMTKAAHIRDTQKAAHLTSHRLENDRDSYCHRISCGILLTHKSS